MAQVTAADITDYTITMRDPSVKPQVIKAAYVTHDGEFLILKDHEHKTLAMVRSDAVAIVRRGDSQPEEDRIREAMAEAQEHPGRTITVS